MSKCRSGCPTQDHSSWGECARDAGLKIAYANSASGSDYTAQKKWDRNLDAYADARRQGIQPASTRAADVRKAVEVSNRTGSAFNAGASLVGA